MIAIFEIDNNINYIKLYNNNVFRLVKTIIIILIIDKDPNAKREDREEEETIIDASSRQRCRLYSRLKTLSKISSIRLYK